MSTQSTTSHPLDGLLQIWNRVSDGQRDAIARDFGAKTGGMMLRQAQAVPLLVPLIAAHRPSLQPGLLANPDGTLPVIPLVADQTPEDPLKLLVRAFAPDLSFQTFGTPVVAGRSLYLFYTTNRAITTQEYDTLELGKSWQILDTDKIVFAPACETLLSAWNSIMPLRYVSRA